MLGNASAYYIWPTVWIGGAPPSIGANYDLTRLADEVYRRKLLDGKIQIKVHREGMIVFDFSGWAPGDPGGSPKDFDKSADIALKRANVMNVHLALLYSSVAKLQNFALEKMIVTPADLIAMKSIDEEGGGFGDAKVAELSLSRYASTYRIDLPNQFDWRLRSRSANLSPEAIAASFDALETVLQHKSADEILILLELLVRSGVAFEQHNYALALINSWALSEKLIQKLWTRYLESRKTETVNGVVVVAIDGNRKKRLSDTRSFTASVIVEALTFAKEISLELYERISKVRKSRNDWIHSLSPVTPDEASCPITVAQDLLKIALSIDVNLPLISRLDG